ncbi:chromate transporter [Hyphomicrobium denitrificans 1NES1]|uniref:Chromate transporter n=1 Tax=Hyphomicrobium denitrificans 1NES1 TaxID=670307 RepID=N0BFK1_9HYPH|nr:chromate efflux transporter [Hyphomicrobium denitrificans]AGK59241.1 chromate transporter [Hyphomicrobium denitrificans 1NES1]
MSLVSSHIGEVFLAFLKLGLTSFGGPVAHLGYFRQEFVERRKWLDEASYADIVALCQFLPGPASSQVGLAIGLSRAGYAGALAAWTAFTLPSAFALVLFAYGISTSGVPLDSGWLHGLKVAAVAVVALAILGMARTLTPDRQRAALAIVAMAISFAVPSSIGQIAAIIFGGLAGVALLREGIASSGGDHLSLSVSRTSGIISLIVFGALLIGLPMLAAVSQAEDIRLFDKFFRVGSLVFGGGHVVLPLLQFEVVSPGWVSNDAFLAGYGAAQAVPGPLFTFAAYLGAVIGGTRTAVFCLVAIFLPSFLLIVGTLPFWQDLRRRAMAQALLRGVNASVVGLLLAAFYNPVWLSGILTKGDFALAAADFVLLYLWKAPPWLVVVLSAIGGQLLATFAV